MKVAFVPFQTPHADSFCHNWAITSNRESAFRSSSLRAAGGGACVGVEASDRLGVCRGRLRCGDLSGERVFSEYCDRGRGAVDVK